MSGLEWKYVGTVERRIRVIKVNFGERHLDAQNVDEGVPFCLDADRGLDLGKIKKAKIYRATIKVFTADLTGELERQLTEQSLLDSKLRHSLQVMKQSGSQFKKFELVSIKW
jgi:hypothetical protein